MSNCHPYKEGDEPVPGYRLVAFLGRGGFGEVWKATAPGGTHLAIKVIPLGGATGRKEFRALRLVRGVRHPNLVPLIAFWLKDKHGDLVDDTFTSRVDLASSKTTEFFARQTMAPPSAAEEDSGSPEPTELILAMGLGQMSLFERLEQAREEPTGGVPDEELLAYMRDAARAIDYLNRPLHDLGRGLVAIQHCDIKPHNMLVVGGAVQLCDFGLASILGDVRTTSAAAGTIAYAAPECLMEGKPSAATDQYSLAVSYYELKTGALPFASESFAHVSSSVINGKLHLARVGAAQQKVLRRATALDPAKRFPTTADMVNALAEAAKSDAAGHQRRRLPLILFVLLVAIGSGGGLVYLKRDQITSSPPAGGGTAPTEPPNTPPPHPALTKEEQASALFAQAQTSFDDKDFSAAVGQLSKLIDEFSADAPQVAIQARLLRGQAELRQSHFDAAIADFERLKEGDPARYEHLTELGAALFARGVEKLNADDFTAALADFVAAREVDREQYGDRAEVAQALVGRGRMLAGEENYADAIANFTTAIDQHANFAKAAYGPRGRCWLKRKEFAKALADLNQAIEFNPDDATALLDRGGVRLDQEEYAEALQDLNRAIELKEMLHDEVTIAYNRRATVRLLIGTDLSGAIDDFTEEIKLEPNALAYSNRGRAYNDRKEFPLAIQDFDAALKMEPNDAETYLNRGFANNSLGNIQSARDDFQRAIDLDNQLETAYTAHGIATKELGDFQRAFADFDQAIKLLPEDTSHEHRSRIYILRGETQAQPQVARYREALQDFAKAQELTPQDPAPYRLKGWLLATCPDPSVRNPQQAIDAATAACKMTNFKDARCLDALAAVNADMGLFDRAEGWEEQAIMRDQDDLKSQYEQRLALYRQKKPFRLGGSE